jgi:hypothetical protein
VFFKCLTGVFSRNIPIVLTFLIAGFHLAQAQITNGDFETGDMTGWRVVRGNLKKQPTPSRRPQYKNIQGKFFIGTSETGGNRPENFDDHLVGEIRSETFTIDSNYIHLLISGGRHNKCFVSLVRAKDDQELCKATGHNSEHFLPVYWDVRSLQSLQCYVRIIDGSRDGWGHINVDYVIGVDFIPWDIEVSILESQVGYKTDCEKRIYLRSAQEKPSADPTGANFELVDSSNGEVVYKGIISKKQKKWLTWWWTLDFSDFNKRGDYYVRVSKGLKQLKSSVFNIRENPFANDLMMIAVDQLSHRKWKHYKGWRDCGSEIHEISSHVITVQALADIYDRQGHTLTKKECNRLTQALMWGADYIVDCQQHSGDPLSNGRFVHSIVPFRGKRSYYYNWHDTAYCIMGLVRTWSVLKEAHPQKAQMYLNSAKLAWENASYRPYHLDSEWAGSSASPPKKDQMDFIHHLARLTYGVRDKRWCLPKTLRTKSKLTFIDSSMLLYNATGEKKYLDKAIEFANQISRRQFTDWQRPLQGCYGMFYEFEDNNEIFTVEWNQDHRWHMGYIEPTNMQGIIDLIRTCPEHPKVACWYNVVRTWGDGFVKNATELSPLGIQPLTCYPKTKEKVCFFKRSNHGFTGMYGQIAAVFLEMGAFLNDNEYQNLAVRNLEFVAGLNPGFPASYTETQWNAISLIKGVGVKSFGGATGLHAIPNGSGMNGFSATPQFDSKLTPYDIPDAPKGILKPDGSFYFNEDYLPSSHGYARGVAFLDDECSFSLKCLYAGKPVQSNVTLNFSNAAVNNWQRECSTNKQGALNVKSLPTGAAGYCQAKYNGVVVSEKINTVSGRKIAKQIDFSNYIELELQSPMVLGRSQAGLAQLSFRNLGDKKTVVNLFCASDGISVNKMPSEIELMAGQKKEIELELTAGRKVMPYLIYIRAVSGNNIKCMTKSGKISRTAQAQS